MNLSAAKLFLAEQEKSGSSENIAFRCEASKRLEEAGDYDGAAEVLGERWKGPGVRPCLSGLNTEEAALLLLRAGMLSHRIGVTEAREGAQDEAKDLLSEAARMFSALRDSRREAEAILGIGLCCWRQTALEEARILINESLTLAGKEEVKHKAAALLALACVEFSAGNDKAVSNDKKALRLLLECRPLVESHGSHRLKAGFHCAMALARRRAGDVDAALIEDAAACYELEQAGDIRQCAALENNVGNLLADARRFEEAYSHYDRAWQLFTSLDDRVHAARVDDSRAQALLAEKRPAEAEAFALRAVAGLEASDEKESYVEALVTLGTVRARLGRGHLAWAAFETARDVACNFISAGAADKITEVLRDEVGPVLFSGRGMNYFAAYRRLQRALIKKALVECEWCVRKAAFNLGLKHSGLQQLLKGTHQEILNEKPSR